MKRAMIVLVSIALLTGLAWIAMQQLGGRPMSADLSRIGQGKAALVLAFENYSPASQEAMSLINQVRADYEAEIDFLVADLGTPRGSEFVRRFDLINGSAVLLNGDGRAVRVYPLDGDALQLRHTLDQELSALR